MGADVTLAKTNLLEQLEALGSPQVTHTHFHTHIHTRILWVDQAFNSSYVCVRLQTEPPSQRHIQIQKELWRIQDVMEALAKNKPQRSTDCSESLQQHSKKSHPAIHVMFI